MMCSALRRLLFSAVFCILFASASVGATAGYLFVTFRNEGGEMAEQIYFALSRDGREWNALHNGRPVLVSEIGEKGARDPYLLRAHDGSKFFLLATDLSIHLFPSWERAVKQGSRSLLIWESTDLVHWSQPRLAPVAPKDAGCTWAPEAIYDEESGDYMVYWASTTGRDHFEKHRIWAARTKDFVTFGEPFVYIEKPVHVIDADIIRANDRYYRFIKDETRKAIAMETSDRLLGEWAPVSGFTLADLQGYEGPECYQLAPNTWCLIADHYQAGKGYAPFVTTDLASGAFKPAPDFKFPFAFRHGSVLPLSEEEFTRLAAAFGAGAEAAITSKP
jgi:sucrose-6-phosphate hydrolase SacC (GH32 family)